MTPVPERLDLRDAERRPRPRRASTQLGGAARPTCGASMAWCHGSARAERERARGFATTLSTQAIKMYTYFNNGEPLLVVDEEPRFGEYPGHKHVVLQTIRRRRTRGGGGGGDEDPVYHLYRKRKSGQWTMSQGIQGSMPTTTLNVDTLMACARHPKNEWGNFEQGTLEQMNARAPRQLQELWDACGAVQKPLLSMEKANSIVNGASTCSCILCPFPTQVRVALYTTEADDSPLAVCRLWARILSAKLKRKGSCGCLMDL